MRSALRMLYKNLIFPKVVGRPFFYTSFVATVDGKVYVNKNGYWPIGSRTDYEAFTNLRAHADAIIDGKNTALRFAKNTIETVHSESFKKTRQEFGKINTPQYIIVTKHPDEALQAAIKNPYVFTPVILKDIQDVISYLQKEQLQNIFVDGGPQLLGSFFENDLIDEVFLTISPRIFGNSENAAITMVEGKLFPPDKIKLEVISMERAENEVFLRYKVLH